MRACTRRIAAASIGTKATSLATERVNHAPWCRPLPRRTPISHQTSDTISSRSVTFCDSRVATIGDMRMPSISRPRALLFVAVALAFLALGGRVILGGGRTTPDAGQTIAALDAGSTATGESTDAADIAVTPDVPASPPLVVHVVGAVHKPGLYELVEGSRIDDAIRKAGGPTPKARLALINLAAPLADGQQIVVPAAGEALASLAGAGSTAAPGQEPTAPVHLNTATLEQLDVLPGVGPVTAQNILQYRDEHGPFGSVDELDAVSGIGPARLEQLRPLVEP